MLQHLWCGVQDRLDEAVTGGNVEHLADQARRLVEMLAESCLSAEQLQLEI